MIIYIQGLIFFQIHIEIGIRNIIFSFCDLNFNIQKEQIKYFLMILIIVHKGANIQAIFIFLKTCRKIPEA